MIKVASVLTLLISLNLEQVFIYNLRPDELSNKHRCLLKHTKNQFEVMAFKSDILSLVKVMLLLFVVTSESLQWLRMSFWQWLRVLLILALSLHCYRLMWFVVNPLSTMLPTWADANQRHQITH